MEMIKNWKKVELGTVANFINGRAFKPEEWENDGKLIIRIQDLTGSINNPNYTTKEFDKRYLVKKGDLLISWSATLDAFLWDKEEGWLNQHIFKVEEDKKILDHKYLYYFVKQSIDLFKKNTHGSTMKHITKGDFDKIKIPLPPIETQKKIVAILEKAEVFKQKRELADKLTQEYLKSVFYEMFLKNKFPEIELEECCEDIFAGGDVPKNNLSWEKTEKYDIPIFTNGEKNRGLYGYTSISKVDKPSITISARGTIGYPEVRNEKFYPAIRLIVLVPNKKIINLYFLKYALNKFDFSSIQGTSIPQLTVPMIKPLKIPLPPIELQNKFASIVEHVEEMKEKQLKNKEYIGEMFNSLMQKAFNGELVK